MNKSARELSKSISVESPVSRTSTISSLSFDDDQLEESQESSWATYTDDIDRQQKQNIFLSDSINIEKIESYDRTDLELSCFAKKLHDQFGKSIYNNRKIVKMKKGVDEDLEDTASSPHSSPTVSSDRSRRSFNFFSEHDD